jgi:hypothetical protein
VSHGSDEAERVRGSRCNLVNPRFTPPRWVLLGVGTDPLVPRWALSASIAVLVVFAANLQDGTPTPPEIAAAAWTLMLVRVQPGSLHPLLA